MQQAARVPQTSYTISELAKEFGITSRTIRFYEEKGMISPLREGQKRLYTPADRVRIKLILRGKRIGMTLQECVEFIDMYDPEHNNTAQLRSLIANVKQRRATLLQVTSRPHAFDDWLRAKDVTGIDGSRGPRFEHHQMAIEAAIAGLGVAVPPLFAVANELARGNVVEALPSTRVRTGKGYWLAYPERRATLPALRAFRAWLLREHGHTPET